MTNSITVNSPTTNSSNSTPSSSRPVLSRLHLPLKQCVLLVAAGEQGEFCSFSAPQKSIAAFGSFAVPASQKNNLLGHSPHLGGPFSRVGPSGRLEGRFPPARLLLPGGRSGGSAWWPALHRGRRNRIRY